MPKIKGFKYILMLLLCIFFIFDFALVYQSTDKFYAGYHNIDLGHNMQVVNIITNHSFVDIGSNNEIKTEIKLYMDGLDQIRESNKQMFIINLSNAILLIGILFISKGD